MSTTGSMDRKKRAIEVEREDPDELGKTKEKKRAKIDESPSLPPEIWAVTLEYLPYSDVKNVAVVSPAFLHQIIPKVTCIHLFDPRELHVRHARRIQAAENVYICCLLKRKERRNVSQNNNAGIPRDSWSLEYSVECKNRIIPYLSVLPKLQFVFLGVFATWIDRSRRVWNGISPLSSDRTVRLSRVEAKDSGFQEHHRSLVDAFCGAFASGSLTPNFKIDGLYGSRLGYCSRSAVFSMFNPPSVNRQTTCDKCRYALQHFPSNWLVNARGGFFCAPAKTRLEAVVKRGATATFHSSNFLERLFAESLVRHQGSHIYIRRSHMEELRAVCQLSLVDPKTFDMRVFFKYLKKVDNPENTTDLKFSRKDFNDLTELGFKTSEADFKKLNITIETVQPGQTQLDQIRHQVEAFNQQLAGNAEVHVEVVNRGDAPNGFEQVFQRVRNAIQARLGDQNGNPFEHLHDVMGGQFIEGPGGAVAFGPFRMPFPMGGVFGQFPPPGDNRNVQGGNNNNNNNNNNNGADGGNNN